MGWLIAAAIIAALAVLPLCISVRYGAGGVLVRAGVGAVLFRVYPQKRKLPEAQNKKKQEKAEETTASQKQSGEKSQPETSSTEKSGGGSWTDFLPLLKLAGNLLNCVRRKIRVRKLFLNVILAGENKADLAMNYGRAWAALGNLYPRLERIFVIQKRSMEIQCDFTAEETKVEGEMILSITLGRLLAIAVIYAIRGLSEFLRIRKLRKGGAKA